ncbi:MAG: pre-peptidase C-terminal domain-containing protein, partial [Planctomycetaceae bacterium]|nr:pre-peptidase C-terminal domain-containing protein [Planctomycetaceae bacterium]
MAGNGVQTGSVRVDVVKFGTVADALADAISNSGLKISAVARTKSVVLSATGKTVEIQGLSGQTGQIPGRLAIDPGAIVKLAGTRIEAGFGATFIAEGSAAYPIVLTSTMDDTYGAGGSFDTTNNGAAVSAAPGNWGGIYFNPTSVGSIDHADVFYAGGSTAIEGGFAVFAPIEMRQATVRVANSLFENNAASTTANDTDPDRNGRGQILQAAVIYGTFSQPILVNNIIRDNQGAAISLDVNSLNSLSIADWGRCTGSVDAYSAYDANYGPLVRGNHLTGNTLNGMVVRSGTLTTEGIWDDTDIVHIVLGGIDIPNENTYGGLRLQSTLSQSLVVKLKGSTAGFTASGRPLEITDRIGGTLQVLGTAGHPVILTSLADDTIGAGVDPSGNPMRDTDNSATTAKAGDWQGISLDQYSNDRNVGVVNETEPATGLTVDINKAITSAQNLGQLANNILGGDDTLRLGFEVHGTIAYDRPGDVDVYSFTGYGGTELWIAIDRTTSSLDSVIELLDASGNVIATSDDWRRTSSFTGSALAMDKGEGYTDVYSTNPKDAGMRVVLPGAAGSQRTYYICVHSAPATSDKVGQTSGHYQLQVRLRPTYEHPGSTVSYADIRYAVTGIDVSGLPGHSVLTTDVYDTEAPGNTVTRSNNTVGTAQAAGNLLQSDQGMLNIGGYLSDLADVDWYKFSIDYGNTIENIANVTTSESVYPVVLDLDFADGLNRPDVTIWVYEENGSARTLIYSGSNSNIVDDRAGLGNGSASDILGSGSYGNSDAYIGPIYLKEGHYYYVAVTSSERSALAADGTSNTTLHYEPLSTTNVVAKDFIGSTGTATYTLFPGTDTKTLNLAAQAYQLNDVGLYVLSDTGLNVVDPYTGTVEGTSLMPWTPDSGDNRHITYGDLVMRKDGRLYTITRGTDQTGTDSYGHDANYYAGLVGQVDTANPLNFIDYNPDGLVTYGLVDAEHSPDLTVLGDDSGEAGGIHMEAVTYTNDNGMTTMYAVGNDPVSSSDIGGLPRSNLLYQMYDDGTAYDTNGADERLMTNIVPVAALNVNGLITGMAFLNGNLYCVTNTGYFYQIVNYSTRAFKEVGNGETSAYSIEDNGNIGAAHAVLISYIAPESGANNAFTGLAVGPANVESGAYKDMVFAVTKNGDLYALKVATAPDPSTGVLVTTATKQPIFLDGAKTIKTGVTNASGLAFSTLDYNLWHATTTDSYTGYSQDTGTTSFYFGLEQNAGQPNAIDYKTNSSVYNTYNLPGGAHGSIVTQAISLAQYSAGDQPMLYFHYSLDKDAGQDAATVYASSDGITWVSLGALTNTNGVWSEARLSLAGFAGQSSVKLRFDFSTGGQWANTVAVAGSDLVALDGDLLEDGDTFTVSYAAGKTGPGDRTSETFEFDMGISLHMPNVAGDSIQDGETFTITDKAGNALKTFEFDKDGQCAAGNIPISIQAGETSAEVAELVADAVNKQFVTGEIIARYYKDRVMLNKAEGLTQQPAEDQVFPSVTKKGNGYGTTATTSTATVDISSNMTAAMVAQQIAAALNGKFAAVGADVFKVDGDMVYLIGHTVTDPGPLPTIATTPDAQYTSSATGAATNAGFLRAADNAHKGFLVDDVIVGFAERGDQYTNATPNLVDFTPAAATTSGAVTQGYYQLQIRLASDFGTWKKGDTNPTITQTIDTNDRLSSGYTLTIPAATDIANGTEFTIGDGVNTRTFQLLDPRNVSSADPDAIPVYFTVGQAASEVASSIATAINNAEAAGLLNVTATSNGVSGNIDLFGAMSLTGLSETIAITVPDGKDIPTGMTFTVEGVDANNKPVTVSFQLVNDVYKGGDGKSQVISYKSSDSADTIAKAIANAINGAVSAAHLPLFTVTAAVGAFTDRVILTNATRVSGIDATETAIHYTDLGDKNQVYDQGQILLENNTITNCSGWGIVVGPGSLTGDSTGFDMPRPTPGPTAPLVTVNTDHQVPGATIENNVIAYNGSGGIHVSGYAQVTGQSMGSVPFARIVNNTVYGASTASTSHTGLSGSGIPSSSGIQLSQSVAAVGYDGDTSAYAGLGDATPTGTTYMITSQYGGTWYDAEKQLPESDTRPGSGDDWMCWAAAASNILAWTGWGAVNGMSSADSIFKYFQDHWTDDGGWGSYAWYWWFTGIDATVGMGVSTVDVPGGNFYPGVDPTNYIEETVDTMLAMRAVDVYLRADYGVTLGIYWPDGAGHEITCWGFTYDSTKATNDPGYYTGVYVTDSDDNKDTNNAITAPDLLRYYSVVYSPSDSRWYLQDVYGDTTPYIGEVVGLKQNPSAPGPSPTGSGVGILVDSNASPTILNNVIARCVTGVSVGSGCGSTVVGATSYFA